MTAPPVLTSVSDGVCTIELSRPEKRNAITTAMYRALSDALDAAAGNAAVRVVFLRGQDDCFTAGNDLTDFMDPASREAAQGQRFLRTISSFPKPIVAAVAGPAVGIGTTMLLHCDLVVASDTARFQLPFVSLGLCPEAGSSMLLPLMAGPRLAAELLMLGDFFDAATAQRAGIVNHVVPAAAVMSHTLAIAHRLSKQSPDALAATKALLKRPMGRSVRDVIEEELPYFEQLIGSDHAKAAFRAFLERR